jgi:hypothetical protein
MQPWRETTKVDQAAAGTCRRRASVTIAVAQRSHEVGRAFVLWRHGGCQCLQHGQIDALARPRNSGEARHRSAAPGDVNGVARLDPSTSSLRWAFASARVTVPIAPSCYAGGHKSCAAQMSTNPLRLLLPTRLHEGGISATLERLADPYVRSRIRLKIAEVGSNNFGQIGSIRQRLSYLAGCIMA